MTTARALTTACRLNRIHGAMAWLRRGRSFAAWHKNAPRAGGQRREEWHGVLGYGGKRVKSEG